MEAKDIAVVRDEVNAVKNSFSRVLENLTEDLTKGSEDIIRKFSYQVSDNASGMVYEDEVYEYIMDEIGYQLKRELENQLEQRINQVNKLIDEYEEYFEKTVRNEKFTVQDIPTIDRYLHAVAQEIEKVCRVPFNFERIFEDFRYNFRRNYGLNEGIMDFHNYGFRQMNESFEEELSPMLRQPVKQLIENLYQKHNTFRKNAIADYNKKLSESAKDIDVGFHLSEAEKFVDYYIGKSEPLYDMYDKIEDQALLDILSKYEANVLSIQEFIQKVKDEPNVNEQKTMLYRFHDLMPKLRTAFERHEAQFNITFNRLSQERERQAQLEAERLRVEEERRKKAEERAAQAVEEQPSGILEEIVEEIVEDPVVTTGENEQVVDTVVAEQSNGVLEEIVEEIVEDPVVTTQTITEGSGAESEAQEEELEEVQEEIQAEVVEEVIEEVIEELPEENVEEVVAEQIEVSQEQDVLQVPDVMEPVVVEEEVVEQLEETGLVVVQPQVEQVVEETGLVVAQPQVEQVVEETGLVVQQPNEIISNNVDFAGLTPHRVTAARKPIALIGETLEEVEELEESPIVSEEVEDEIPTVEEEEVQRDQGPYQSAKAQSMRRIIDSKKATFDKRSTLAVLAAAGLGGASLIAGLPVTLPLIAAGLAVISVGGHLQVNLKEFAGRKATEFTLSTIAIMNDVELEYVDGKLKFTGKGGAELTQKQKEKLQRKLDKKFKNKYRGLSNPRLIQELQYKGFDKVTIDNLNAAFDEFGGITSKEVQSLLEEVNDIEVDLETETIEEEVPEVSEEEVLVAAEPEVEVVERQVVPANTSVITKIINGEDVQVLQGEVIDTPEEEIEEEVEQEQQYDFDVDPDLVNASQLLDANVGNAISTMNQSNIDAISQSCVDMFNGISDIFYNNRIENNEQLTALPMHKFNEDVRKINDNLMTSVKNHFDNINHQAMVATDRLMQVPNENKAELISNLQNAYLKHASISGMMKDLSSNFKELLEGICNQYGITQDSKAYSELVELMNQHQIKIESNMYNQMIEFTNVNAMAISTVFNTFGYKEDLNESRSRGM